MLFVLLGKRIDKLAARSKNFFRGVDRAKPQFRRADLSSAERSTTATKDDTKNSPKPAFFCQRSTPQAHVGPGAEYRGFPFVGPWGQ